MFGNKGQAYDAMKFLQGGVIAVVLLGIVYGGLQIVRQYEPGADVAHVAAGLLSSAYSAAGTGVGFSGKARLKPMQLTGEGIKALAGIDNDNLHVNFRCSQPVGTYKGEVCSRNVDYKEVQLSRGGVIYICVICSSASDCVIYLGSSSCNS